MRQVSVSNGGFAGCSACRLNQLGSLVASSGPCIQQYTSAVCTNFEWIYYSTLSKLRALGQLLLVMACGI